MELYEKTVSSEEKFKGVIVDVRLDRIELPNGRPASWSGGRTTGCARCGSWRRRRAIPRPR